jgi:hypothetical protein
MSIGPFTKQLISFLQNKVKICNNVQTERMTFSVFFLDGRFCLVEAAYFYFQISS